MLERRHWAQVTDERSRGGIGLRPLLLLVIAMALASVLLREGLRPAPDHAAALARQDSLVTGFRAPLVSARSNDTTTRGLGDYRGDVVLVEYWATWCAPCNVALSDLAALDAEYRGTDLRIVAISIDAEGARAAIAREIARRDLRFDVLHDVGHHGREVFGVWGVPMSFLIDRTGTIRARTYGIRADGVSSHWAWPESRALIDSLLREPQGAGVRS